MGYSNSCWSEDYQDKYFFLLLHKKQKQKKKKQHMLWVLGTH